MKKRVLIFALAGLTSGIVSTLVVEGTSDWDKFLIHVVCCGPIFFFAVYFAEFASNRWVGTSRKVWRILTALVTFSLVTPLAISVFPFAAWIAQSLIGTNGSENTNDAVGEFIFALFVSSVAASSLVTLAIWALSGRWQRRLLISLQVANFVTLFAVYVTIATFTHWTVPKEIWGVMLPVGEGLYCVGLSTAKLDPMAGDQDQNHELFAKRDKTVPR